MSRPGSAGSITSPHPVLPPIISSEKDRTFLIQLNGYIEDEIAKLNCEPSPEQRFTVYKAAFDRIIDYVSAYKPLLTAVKAEYEDCIETIQRGQREAFYLSGKVKAMTSEPSTIRNYRKRGDELEQKLAVIRNDNARLQEQVMLLRKKRLEKQQEREETAEIPKKQVKRDHRPIPGLSVRQSTDLKTLNRELEKLEKQLKELNLSYRTRYSPKEVKDTLKEQLHNKVEVRDSLAEETVILRAKCQKLKIAVEAAETWGRQQPPHQTIGEAVVVALARANRQWTMDKGEDGLGQTTPSTTFEEDDPSREKEAEMMLEYIEKFNELLEDGKYDQAAIHAANSPKGILRTPETLHRFKELGESSSPTPLLMFCEALLSTVPAYGVKPNEYISRECLRCALRENRLDLIIHWIAQKRLTLSEPMGELILAYGDKHPGSSIQCLALAQQVYLPLGCHLQVVMCMTKQGRVRQALEYAQHTAQFDLEDYAAALRLCPTEELTTGLLDRNLLPLGVIVRALLDTEAYEMGLKLVQDLFSQVDQGFSDKHGAIRVAVFADNVTSMEEWHEIIGHLQDQGYEPAGVELLAAVTVKTTLQVAMQLASPWPPVTEISGPVEANDAGDSRVQEDETEEPAN